MSKDVEMKEANGQQAAPKKKEEEKGEGEKAKALPKDVLRSCVVLLTRAVKSKETRALMGRVLRQTAGLRKQILPGEIQAVAAECLAEGCPLRGPTMEALKAVPAQRSAAEPGLVSVVDVEMLPDAEKPAGDAPAEDKLDEKPNAALPTALPEAEAYVCLVAVMKLCDLGRYQEALLVVDAAVARLAELNRRSMDVLAARLYFYYSWVHERLGQLRSVRTKLLELHRTATLRHDEIGQETLMNLVLRNYLQNKEYDLAERFRSQAQQQDVGRSTQQLCRHLHYMGRIHAIQLNYTEARDCLQQALRKAPSVARGFRVTTLKWLTLVRLLLGEVPERTELMQPQMATAMAPYVAVTQVVRRGKLKEFREVSERHGAAFAADGTSNLIDRLRNNVIRAGLRRISLAYSRISLADVAARLGLEGSRRDIECMVAKAIRDGSVDVSIDHDAGCLVSNEVLDIYSTYEPQHAFHARISFCLDLNNDAMRAMRFEPKGKGANGTEEHALMTEEELAEALEEDDGF